MRRIALLSAAALALAITGTACGSEEEVTLPPSPSPFPSHTPQRPTPTETSTLTPAPTPVFLTQTPMNVDAILAELDRNSQKWQAAGITDYRFTLALLCFCQFYGQVQVEVHGDLVAMTLEDGKLLMPGTPGYEAHSPYSTIERAFDAVRTALGKADHVDIVYDPTLGYPTTIRVDYVQRAVDDELSIEISAFTPLGG